MCPGRLGSKLEEVKAKYLRSEAKVRNAHNGYLIALNDANVYQRQYSCVILPALLDSQQHFQEDLVSLWCVCLYWNLVSHFAFSALTLLAGHQEEHPCSIEGAVSHQGPGVELK